MSEQIVNKVAASGLINLDLSEYAPTEKFIAFDLKPLLWQELVLKEKDFRAFVKSHDWTQYKNAAIAVYCSADAIIPDWAYMLVASALSPHAKTVYFGTTDALYSALFVQNIRNISPEEFSEARVVVKGCGDEKVPTSAFVELVARIQPVVKSLMYGEPCSTVPIYKNSSK